MVGKSSGRELAYRKDALTQEALVARFAEQMADYARGQRLLELRVARHLSQEAAAHEIGTTAKSLRKWEHGGAISWNSAQRVASFYGVDPESIVSAHRPEDEIVALPPPDEDTRQLNRIETELADQRRMLDAILVLLAPLDLSGEGAEPGAAQAGPEAPQAPL